MGGMLQGFVGGLAGSLSDQIQQRHEEDLAERQRQRQLQEKILFDTSGVFSDADKAAAFAELKKVSGPQARKALDQHSPLLRGIHALGQLFRHPAFAQTGGGAPQPDATTGAAATPAQRFRQGPAGWETLNARALQARRDELQVQEEAQLKLKQDERNQQIKALDEIPDDVLSPARKAEIHAEIIAGRALPPVPKEETLSPVMLKMKDAPDQQALRSKDGKYYFLDATTRIDPESIDRELPKPSASGGYVRSVPHAVSLEDAKANKAAGVQVFHDQEGNDIDLNKLPPDMGLQAMVQGDKMFWVPVTPNQKTVTVGNVVYAVTPWEAKSIATGGGTPLGPQRVGTTGTREQIAIDPVTGQLTTNVLTTTTTPQTPGAPGRPAATAAPTAVAPAQTPAGAPRSAPPPRAQPAAPAPAPQGRLRGYPVGTYNTQQQRAVPVREAATQIFGDPSQPTLKGLKDYIDLADNPASRERLGKALNLTFDGLNKNSGGAALHGNAGPISVSTGGFGTWLQNAFGLPANLAAQQSEIMTKAIGELTPEEREYYDAVMSSFSTVVGLRSLTRASAAQASVTAIERELPIIGLNTYDSRQFADQLQRAAEVVTNGVKSIPRGFLDPALEQRISNLPGEMQKLKESRKSATAAGAPRRAAPAPPKKGDVQEGYRFKGGDPANPDNWEKLR